MKSYHFDCGNSTSGPVGLCARVRAESAEEAVATLNEALRQVPVLDVFPHGRVDYINVYLGKVTSDDIDDEEDVEDET